MKFIDLHDEIEDSLGSTRAAIERILEWLDEHSDQVPGRTITESEFHETADAHRNGGLGWEDLARRFGITIIPDPEPTNAEKLAKMVRRACDNLTPIQRDEITRYFDEAGVKAPGASES